MNTEKNKKHRILFATGTALALLGGAMAAIKYKNFMCWSFSFMVSMVGLWMMHTYRVRGPTRQSTNAEQRPGRLAWLLGVLSILTAGASFFFCGLTHKREVIGRGLSMQFGYQHWLVR
jgi:uncharacterized membrane protein YfcA